MNNVHKTTERTVCPVVEDNLRKTTDNVERHDKTNLLSSAASVEV